MWLCGNRGAAADGSQPPANDNMTNDMSLHRPLAKRPRYQERQEGGGSTTHLSDLDPSSAPTPTPTLATVISERAVMTLHPDLDHPAAPAAPTAVVLRMDTLMRGVHMNSERGATTAAAARPAAADADAAAAAAAAVPTVPTGASTSSPSCIPLAPIPALHLQPSNADAAGGGAGAGGTGPGQQGPATAGEWAQGVRQLAWNTNGRAQQHVLRDMNGPQQHTPACGAAVALGGRVLLHSGQMNGHGHTNGPQRAAAAAAAAAAAEAAAAGDTDGPQGLLALALRKGPGLGVEKVGGGVGSAAPVPRPSTRTASGRRKCTTERNRDKLDVLTARVAALQAVEAALSAQHSALVLKNRVLLGMIAVRDDMAALSARHAALLLRQNQRKPDDEGAEWAEGTMGGGGGYDERRRVPVGQLPNSRPLGALPHMPDAQLLRAGVMSVGQVAAAVKQFVSTAGGLLLMFESAPRDAVSDALEARLAEAAAAGSSTASKTTVPEGSSGFCGGFRAADAERAGMVWGCEREGVGCGGSRNGGMNGGMNSGMKGGMNSSMNAGRGMLSAGGGVNGGWHSGIHSTCAEGGMSSGRGGMNAGMNGGMKTGGVPPPCRMARAAVRQTAGLTGGHGQSDMPQQRQSDQQQQVSLTCDNGQSDMPPRAGALVRLVALMEGTACAMRALLAVNPCVVVGLQGLNLDTLEAVEPLSEGAVTVLADKLRLTPGQRALMARAIEHHEAVMEAVRGGRRATAAVLNGAVHSQQQHCPGATSLESKHSITVCTALTRLQALLRKEHTAVYSMVSFLFTRVLTPLQAATLHVHSWPRAADPLAVAYAVARQVAAAAATAAAVATS